MRKFVGVWQEGYNVEGQSGKAHLLGVYFVENFEEAVEKMLTDNPRKRALFEKKVHPATMGSEPFTEYWIWCTRLFDNEKSARKWFG